jgi:hypothetical protein
MGQDDLIPPDIGSPVFDTSGPLSPGIFSPQYPEIQPLIDQGFTPDEADMISAAAANGVIDDAQFQSILSGNHSYEEVSNIIFSHTTPTTGPMPSSGGSQSVSAGTKAATEIAKAAASFNKPNLGPGASPRVGTRPPGAGTPPSGASILTQQAISGVPNWALLAAAAVAMFAMRQR